jgi:hypothetical protein
MVKRELCLRYLSARRKKTVCVGHVVWKAGMGVVLVLGVHVLNTFLSDQVRVHRLTQLWRKLGIELLTELDT